MATTGFWPVKSRLKEVIDYADNPDKTTERKYLDDDLAKALVYTENDSKTDRKMYVTGINCLMQSEHRPYRPKQFPLESVIKNLSFEIEHSYDTATVFVDTLFLIFLTLVDILNELSGTMLLSPDLRYEVKNFESYVVDYNFLKANDIHTIIQLKNGVTDTKTEIASLEADRQKVSNQIRRAKTPEEIAKLKIRRKEITAQITPLRKKLKQTDRILEKSPHLYELLQTEHRLEKTAINKLRERSYER